MRGFEWTKHVIERPGCVVAYWLAGPADRPLVALLHGATMDHHMFADQVGALTAHYRVLAWDARGHGESRPTEAFTLKDCADDLIAILDQLGVEQVVLVGQSMGGYIAQVVYRHYPQRIQALVSIGSTCIALPYAWWEILALRWTLPLFRVWPYDQLARLTARSIALKPEVQAYALETIRQLNRREFLTIWQALTPAISRQGIPGHVIRVPLLLTHGDQDHTGSIQRQAPIWAAYEPDVEYHVIPDASHNANQDQPAVFNELLLSFLARHIG